MGLFDKMFGKPKETPARLIMLSGVMASEIMLEKNQLSKGAVFEVLLFSSLHILRKFRQRRANLYTQFEADYFNEVHNFAREEGILNQIPTDFTDFVNNRFQLYGQQLNSMYDNNEGNFIPTKIAYNFYEKPLTKDSGDSFDLPAVMMLTMKMKHLFEALDGSVDLIIKESNL